MAVNVTSDIIIIIIIIIINVKLYRPSALSSTKKPLMR